MKQIDNQPIYDARTLGKGRMLVLYGMISAVGVRNLVENQVNFKNNRNVLIAALIMVLAIGIQYSPAGCIQIGKIALSGLAVAALVGVILNAILPGNDFEMTFDYVTGKDTDAPALQQKYRVYQHDKK